MNRVLVAIDGSDGSNAAVEEALALAPGLEAAVTFVYVRKSPPPRLGSPFYEGALHADLERARSVVEAAMETAAQVGTEADGEIIEGNPADEIISLADNRDCDLIVVGSRGFGALAGALLGSVSHAVVQHANRPVLVAKQRPVRQRQVA
ncbi:MAG: universal stress protein [Actinobacteria bacterium]|nr:MAG: universal stress protein [Actinomycetota bacterium]